ncbi:MAG: hypothetical protein A2Y75_01630 [Candidatus Solincola sediminis]|uniref:PEP-CTERM sorting domain-containing protein n=1 Tax=Candidatus Solincola sediminis TaxID=1797199 RepID=A0A1F2WNJ4_9ACTN|nr:MAG: hypothetical protein A2Y75_01630 [Candidatus Solincola sediminis]
MRKLLGITGAVAALIFATSALAGKTQVSSNSWRASGSTGAYYGRSDGVFQSTTTHTPYVVENGQPAGSLGKGFYMDFTVYSDGEGITCGDAGGMGACGGNTTLVPCQCTISTGDSFMWMPIVTETLTPDMDAGSLDIAGDLVDNDGAYLIWGLNGASGNPFTIGRDPAFYMCTKYAISGTTTTTVSGIDQNVMAGFMEVGINEAWNADFEARNSYAGIGVLGTAASGLTLEDVYIKTEDDGGGVVSTDTTDSSTENVAQTLCTYVSSAGVVTYTIDGSAPTVTATYTFDDNVAVVPFITYLHTADLADEIDIYSVKVGYTE